MMTQRINYRINLLRITANSAFKEASKEELRTLVALIEADGKAEDALELSEAAGISLARCKAALAFWEESGVIREDDGSPSITDEFDERIVRGEISEAPAVEVAESIRNEDLADMLNDELVGLSAEMINLPIIMRLEAQMHSGAFLVNPAVKSVYEVMNELDGGEMRYSGINQLLKYPEYSDTQQFGELLGTLESQEEILELVSRADSDDINVLIGSENSVKVMSDSAIVFKQIKKDGRTIGAIGVVGPRRMDYARVLASLNELGENISDLIEDTKLLKDDGGEDSD